MRKKKIQTIRFLNHGCYPGHTMFSCGFTYDEIMVELRKMERKSKDKDGLWSLAISGDKELIDGGFAFGMKREVFKKRTNEEKILFYIIMTDQFKFEDYDYCKLAHEVLHICQFFLSDVLKRDMEIEAEAYFHTHLMSQCLKALRG